MFKERIEAAKARRIDALLRADVDAYIDGYDENGAILTPKGQVIKGKEKLREQMEHFVILLGPMHHVLVNQEYWPEEGHVLEKGTFSYCYLTEEDPFYTGTYLYLWKEQSDGEYLLLRELHIDD